MLKTEQLRCFIATVDAGSIAGAGLRLNLSPSAVGYAIDALEEQLDTSLLVRRRSAGVSLTLDGSRLLQVVRPLVQDLADIGNLFAGEGGELSGELVIGCQEALSWSIAPRAIERISKRHPSLDIALKTIFLDDGNRPLLDAEVDVLVTFLVNPVDEPGIDQDILHYPQPFAMMRRHHPLDRDGAPVTIAELSHYPQLFVHDGPALGLFSGMYRDQHLNPEYSLVANISTSAQAIIGVSDSVSLRMVRPAHDRSPLGHELAYAPVADYNDTAALAICTVRPRHGRKSPKVRELLRVCRELVLDGTMKEHFFYGRAGESL